MAATQTQKPKTIWQQPCGHRVYSAPQHAPLLLAYTGAGGLWSRPCPMGRPGEPSPGQCSNHDHALLYVFQKPARVVMVTLWLLGDLEVVAYVGGKDFNFQRSLERGDSSDNQ